MKSRLELRELRLPVSLGVSVEERAVQQWVRLTLEFEFQKPPMAIETDSIHDTIGYDQIASLITRFLEKKSFCLIESLGNSVLNSLRQFLAEKGISQTKVKVGVLKEKLPMPFETSGAYFEISD